MLTKDTIKKLKALGFDTDKLIAAAKSEEETAFELPEINNLSEADLTTRDTNVIAAARKDIFNEGKTAGIEITNKAIAKKYGLIDVDTKDPDKVITALDAKVATGDTGLKEQISLLQSDKTAMESKLAEKDKSFKDMQFDNDLISHFPPNRTGMNDKKFLALVKMDLGFEEADGVTVVKKDGQILRDPQTKAPIQIKDAIDSYFAENKWVAEESKGGRGGKDNPGGGSGGIKKESQAQAQFLKDNPSGNLMSVEYQTYLTGLIKATTDFDIDG